MSTGRITLYGFRKGDKLVKELDGSYTFFPTYDEAEAHLNAGERVAHVSVKASLFPKEAR